LIQVLQSTFELKVSHFKGRLLPFELKVSHFKGRLLPFELKVSHFKSRLLPFSFTKFEFNFPKLLVKPPNHLLRGLAQKPSIQIWV